MTRGTTVLALCFGLWPVTATAQTAEAFEKAYAGGNWAAAAQAGERWAEREPENSGAAYNAACAFALAGNAEAALDWLRRAGTSKCAEPSFSIGTRPTTRLAYQIVPTPMAPLGPDLRAAQRQWRPVHPTSG